MHASLQAGDAALAPAAPAAPADAGDIAGGCVLAARELKAEGT